MDASMEGGIQSVFLWFPLFLGSSHSLMPSQVCIRYVYVYLFYMISHMTLHAVIIALAGALGCPPPLHQRTFPTGRRQES